MNTNQGLFHDVLVVELASVLAGPSVGQFFAEMGATVLKVENIKTRGDVTRSWKVSSEPVEGTVSAYFSAANWGKKSLCVDLSVPRVQEMVHQIIGQADVVLVSFKLGDAEKLRMDYKTLAQLNPRLLYGHITGYGSDEPRAGYDAVLQAEAGFMYLNGEKDGGPLKMPVALIDLMAAHQLKEGLLAALYSREKTGKGQYLEVSLLRAAVASLANQATNYLVAGSAPVRMGSEHPNIVPYGTVFKTADQKELVLAIGDDRQFQALCGLLGKPELAQEPAYKTNNQRVKHREELNKELTGLIARHERETLLQALIDHHVPAGAVNTVPEALAQPLAQPQLFSLEAVAGAGVRQVAFDGPAVPALALAPPPVLGQHTHEILQRMAGVTEQELEEMIQAGLIL
ncbi:CaiB/BaiF CoA transferase family protein [Rufibacter immobilis]|uniref:CaiB/BaiF CoA transferase family protein n=1 Tax=Rufibacter immobilis TaxID=1348778 RepID=UPI0035E77B60